MFNPCLSLNPFMYILLTYLINLSYSFTDSPVISFGPYNPLTVIEEERTTLTCVIDANPLATDVRWIKDGTVIGKSKTFSYSGSFSITQCEKVPLLLF